MFSPIMANKSYKQHRRSEKVQIGCMSGLIRLFDFRRSPKLLSDGSHVISRYSVRSDIKDSEDLFGTISADNNKDRGIENVYAGRASIKALMEEEMASSTQALKQMQRDIFGLCSDGLKSVNLPEGSDVDLNLAASLMEIYRNHKEGQDSDSVESGCTSGLADKENNTDSGARLNQIPSSIQKALEDVAEAVLSHQSSNTEHITSSSEARSREFVDALQLLSSNKELFLMLLHDPSSRLLQCLQNLYTSLGSPTLELAESDEETKSQMNNNLEQAEASQRKVQGRHNSFLKEDKLVMRKPSKLNDSPCGLSRIVILKPSPARSQSSLISSSATSSPLSSHTNLQGQKNSDKSARHFSLRELKRRLRLAISDNQKDHLLNSTSSALQKADSTNQFPIESMSIGLASTDIFDCERAEQRSIVDKETNSEGSGSGLGNDATHAVNSFSYEKARKHLVERLDDQGDDSSQIVHKSESFGRLISFPKYDTFSPSHRPQQEDISLSHEVKDSSTLQTIEQEDSSASSNPPRQYKETLSSGTSTLANRHLDELKTDLGNQPFKEGTTSQELINEEVKNIQDAVDSLPLRTEIENSSESLKQKNSDQCSSEEAQSMSVLPEVSLYSPDDLINEQEDHSPSAVVEIAKPSRLTFACSLENANEKEEKLSPQSVLDPFLGDSTSPSHKTRKQDEFSTPSSRILFKELDTTSASLTSPTLQNKSQVAILNDKYARVSFIKAVLEASELLAEESSERWYMDGSLLDTSVLAEVGVSYCLTDDAVLLFDCVEESLIKIRDKFFGIDPWVAFLKHSVRPAPIGANLVQEVAKCIDSLVYNEFPNTLDQVVMKDLEGRSWMDLRCDSESVVIEVWDGLLDDLLEEMAFDLWL